MRKHINNKLYDTNTAKCIGVYETDSSISKTDIRYLKFALYKKRTGEYFSCTEHSSSTVFEPLEYEQARTLAQKYFSNSEYSSEFEKKVENGKSILNISLSAQTRAKLEKIQANRKKSLSTLISELIEKETQVPILFKQFGIDDLENAECYVFCVETDEDDSPFYTDSFKEAVSTYLEYSDRLDSDCNDCQDLGYTNVFLELYIAVQGIGTTIYLATAR